jgi:hypothetical protein
MVDAMSDFLMEQALKRDAPDMLRVLQQTLHPSSWDKLTLRVLPEYVLGLEPTTDPSIDALYVDSEGIVWADYNHSDAPMSTHEVGTLDDVQADWQDTLDTWADQLTASEIHFAMGLLNGRIEII